MLDKMIGVSPPQKGQAQESKIADLKDLRGTADERAKFKSDFERALKEKQDQKKQDLESKRESDRRDELRAEKKEKKSSGGTKKRMAEVDEKMVSNGMASVENVVETPNSEESAKIKVSNQELEAILKTESSGLKPVMPEAAQNAETGELMQAAQAETLIDAKASQQTQLNDEQALSFENRLQAEVGFKSQDEDLLGRAALTDTKKTEITGDLKQNSLEAPKTDFEKNVLERLQKESSFNSQQFSSSDQGGSGLDGQDKSDLKSDLVSQNQLHQSAGQSHTMFKTHLETAQSPNGPADKGSLEGNREANINEIMNQAQYLVKKGGGEVSVKMSPEGMGEVQLKVLLNDGKLNIEMQTQDKNVKKLIEESLSDLKSGLAAHRLSLEHVKIDTVNATNTENNTQLQSNLNQGGSENRTRELWNEAQSQNGERSHNPFSQNRNSESRGLGMMASTMRTSQEQALRTYGGTKGATLNRVA